MAVESLDANTALVSLQSIYPEAAPNAGISSFCPQVQLHFNMLKQLETPHDSIAAVQSGQCAYM